MSGKSVESHCIQSCFMIYCATFQTQSSDTHSPDLTHGTTREDVMSDSSSPDFKVVDRRRSTSVETDVADDVAPDAPATSAPAEAADTDADTAPGMMPHPG